MKYFSPAKINLFLKILGKREDGFHEIATLIQAVSLFDELDIHVSNDVNSDQLTCSDSSIPTDSTNLVSKAVELFRKKSGLSFSTKIHLQKNIPHQAGLGGGSGNAATTLFALNEHFQFPFSEKELQNLSSELGSDIPFFFSQGLAYCTGRGEVVQSLKPLAPSPIWILKPPFGLPTVQVYKAFASLPRSYETKDPLISLDEIQKGRTAFFNDLEHAAFHVSSEMGSLKETLEKGAMMSGSGSAFFHFQPLYAKNCEVYQAQTTSRVQGKWFST